MTAAGRPLVLAIAAIVASFLVTLGLSQQRLGDVEAQVYEVAAVAEPSIVHLDAARSELEQMGRYTNEYVTSIAGGLPARASRERALAARDRLRHDLASYEGLPFFAGEEALFRNAEQRLAAVDRAVDGILAHAEAGDLGAARMAIVDDLHPGIERVSAMLKGIIDHDTALALERLSGIRRSRRRAATTALVFGGLSLALSTVAALVALRALAQAAARQRQIDEERAARVSYENALRGRDQFIALAGHELRTPLTALQVALGALTRKPERPATGLLTAAERQLARMSDLVEELVQIAQIDLGSLVLVPALGDLIEIVRARIESRRTDIERSGSSVSLHAEGQVIGRWDAAALGRAVDKLLSNAVKFGEGKPIDVTVSAQGAAARLVVRDRGLGISPDRVEAVFDRFERGVSEAHYPGFGLGLYIARAIVRAHGGSIRASSTLGEGTTITVDLPAGMDASAAQDDDS